MIYTARSGVGVVVLALFWEGGDELHLLLDASAARPHVGTRVATVELQWIR